jgi:serpin B
MKFIVLATVILSVGLFAPGARAADDGQSQPLQAVVNGQTALAMALYDHLRTVPGNLFFSPYSIDTALMMVYGGAAGKTASEMAATLHLPDAITPIQLHQAVGELIGRLQHPNKDTGYQLQIANGLWAQVGVHWLPAYLDLLRNDYSAEAFAADFSQPEMARQSINDWVTQQTSQKITDLLPSGSITSATRLVLADAVYFKADWASPFRASATHKGDFHVNANTTTAVAMMNQTGSFAYMEDGQVQALQMPYAGGDWAMLLILPKTADGLSGVEATMDAARLNRIVAALADQSVQVSLPKFQLSQNFSLREILRRMGMALAFSPREADFSGMDGQRDLCLSDVMHKAYVAVDEQGTEAAAATGGLVVATFAIQPRHTFIADHPFMFLLRDRQSAVILFAGRLSQPTQ